MTAVEFKQTLGSFLCFVGERPMVRSDVIPVKVQQLLNESFSPAAFLKTTH